MIRVTRPTVVLVVIATCFLMATGLLRPKLIHAQQNLGETYTGSFYIAAYVDVDGGNNAYGTSTVQSDDPEEAEYIGADGYLSEDNYYIAHDSDDGYERISFSFSSDGPVSPGHYYGTQTDGYECYNYGEYDGDCDDLEYVASAYASVYVVPPPHITSLNPSSVNQGATGTLTMNGTNLVVYPGDQLTLNYSGQGMPFNPTGTPSSTSAQYTYDFNGYDTGTYQISVTNNYGTSNQVSFTVNPPQQACTQSRTPNSFALNIGSLANAGQSGTFTVSHPTATSNSASTTVNYGPSSTPSSVAAQMASAITRKYVHSGITAQSNGSNITIQSRSLFANIAANSPGSTYSIGSASTVSCLAPPQVQGCDGTQPDYDTARPYKNDRTFETPRAHITRRHIDGAPSLRPYVTQYYTIGATASSRFLTVENYNITTFLHDPIGSNGVHKHVFPSISLLGFVWGAIGRDASDNNLNINEFHLDFSTCQVETSFPTNR